MKAVNDPSIDRVRPAQHSIRRGEIRSHDGLSNACRANWLTVTLDDRDRVGFMSAIDSGARGSAHHRLHFEISKRVPFVTTPPQRHVHIPFGQERHRSPQARQPRSRTGYPNVARQHDDCLSPRPGGAITKRVEYLSMAEMNAVENPASGDSGPAVARDAGGVANNDHQESPAPILTARVSGIVTQTHAYLGTLQPQRCILKRLPQIQPADAQ
jgi:hypothetical protein